MSLIRKETNGPPELVFQQLLAEDAAPCHRGSEQASKAASLALAKPFFDVRHQSAQILDGETFQGFDYSFFQGLDLNPGIGLVQHRSIASYGGESKTRSQSTINARGRSMIVTIIVVLCGTGQDLFSAFLVQSFGLSNVSALQTFERFLFLLLAEAIHHDHGHLADRTGRIWNTGHLSGHSRCSLHASSSKGAKPSQIIFVPNLT
jgi:hypothetical protein